MAQFSPDEADLINRLAEDGLEDTAANLNKAMQGMERYGKKTVGRITHKLSPLSEETCAELIVTTKNRKLAERGFSIRHRLSKIRGRRQKQGAVKENGRGKKVEKGGMEL